MFIPTFLFVSGPLTLHTESAIFIAEMMTGAKFTIRNIFIEILFVIVVIFGDK